MHFARADGRTDRETVEAHDASLKEWLTMAIEAPLDAQLSACLAEVGRAHTGRGREPRARVEARYLLATISFLQSELIGVLDGAIAERRTLVATISGVGQIADDPSRSVPCHVRERRKDRTLVLKWVTLDGRGKWREPRTTSEAYATASRGGAGHEEG